MVERPEAVAGERPDERPGRVARGTDQRPVLGAPQPGIDVGPKQARTFGLHAAVVGLRDASQAGQLAMDEIGEAERLGAGSILGNESCRLDRDGHTDGTGGSEEVPGLVGVEIDTINDIGDG